MGEPYVREGGRLWVGPAEWIPDTTEQHMWKLYQSAEPMLLKSFEFTVAKHLVEPEIEVNWKKLTEEWSALGISQGHSSIPHHNPMQDAAIAAMYHLPVPNQYEPLPDVEVAQIVRATADLIEKHGWVQGTFGTIEQGFCVMGALNFVAQRVGAVIHHISMQFGLWLHEHGEPDHIATWNDDKHRTKDEILLYLHKFADELDPDGAGHEDS